MKIEFPFNPAFNQKTDNKFSLEVFRCVSRSKFRTLLAGKIWYYIVSYSTDGVFVAQKREFEPYFSMDCYIGSQLATIFFDYMINEIVAYFCHSIKFLF